ncbi:hypothetical protein CCM_08434 [Cordyceps militaris CM01]|uniref:Uncharacterized protein n=1 Tax=Cordyceps militaris (strain CM01) TaxID=983644 RepID=G3JR95_CORMM|nr:uncharacterized protein CCM_08434 [Cordyceps militaris CM01]EGX88391.1 hypothetical protein CCM_08434 [Cordyceps militaris CM01]
MQQMFLPRGLGTWGRFSSGNTRVAAKLDEFAPSYLLEQPDCHHGLGDQGTAVALAIHVDSDSLVTADR